jgi:hypothetical protein
VTNEATDAGMFGVIETEFPLEEHVSERILISVLPAVIVTSIGVERRDGQVATVVADKVT